MLRSASEGSRQSGSESAPGSLLRKALGWSDPLEASPFSLIHSGVGFHTSHHMRILHLSCMTSSQGTNPYLRCGLPWSFALQSAKLRVACFEISKSPSPGSHISILPFRRLVAASPDAKSHCDVNYVGSKIIVKKNKKHFLSPFLFSVLLFLYPTYNKDDLKGS